MLPPFRPFVISTICITISHFDRLEKRKGRIDITTNHGGGIKVYETGFRLPSANTLWSLMNGRGGGGHVGGGNKSALDNNWDESIFEGGVFVIKDRWKIVTYAGTSDTFAQKRKRNTLIYATI